MPFIHTITPREPYIEIEGDITVYDIQDDVVLIINNGNLTVSGNIGNNVSITLRETYPDRFLFSPLPCVLDVHGNVGNKTSIHSQNASYFIDGHLGNDCRIITYSGSINLNTVGKLTQIISVEGNIHYKEARPSAIITANKGKIHSLENPFFAKVEKPLKASYPKSPLQLARQ